MPKFKYIVVNKENKQLSGVVDSPNEKSAREELQELGFSIVSLEKETKKEAEKETGILFEFSGIDNQGKTIKGTIRSESRYTAFKRLITEYELDVRYIVDDALPSAEKTKIKKKGVIELMKKYQQEVQKNTELFHKKKFKKIDRNFEDQKALVMRQVDFVLSKTKNAIIEFGKDLNPQDKQELKDYINKILRLKNSTNLEYIKQTCKDLLKFLQNAEIFTHKKENLEGKVKLYADTQDMIDKIQQGKEFGVFEDLEDKINRWQSDHIKNKKDIPLSDKIKNLYYKVLLKFIHQPEEIRLHKKGIKKINHDLKHYRNIYIKAKDKNYRNEAAKSINNLKNKKKKLEKELHIIRKNINKEISVKGETNIFEYIVETLNGITGWLLFFYLVYYFVAIYITTKQIGYPQNDIPSVFYIFNTGSIKYVLPTVFLLHITTSLKIVFFKKNLISNVVIFPMFFITTLLIVFNF